MTGDETADTLLGGRLRYAQPRGGFRTGIEPVLLAAAAPARAGELVVEAGCGAGAGLLCLARRVPAVTLLGIEIDPATAALAARNAAANEFAARITIEHGDVLARRALNHADHVIANPPYHGAGTASPVAAREIAKRAGEGLILDWVTALARLLRARGTLTFIVPAARLTETMHAFAIARCGGRTVYPLWPRAGTAAKLVLVQGTSHAKGADRLLPGLVLHADGGEAAPRYTAAADAILRDGAALGL